MIQIPASLDVPFPVKLWAPDAKITEPVAIVRHPDTDRLVLGGRDVGVVVGYHADQDAFFTAGSEIPTAWIDRSMRIDVLLEIDETAHETAHEDTDDQQ